jgi:hypothetical protein
VWTHPRRPPPLASGDERRGTRSRSPPPPPLETSAGGPFRPTHALRLSRRARGLRVDSPTTTTTLHLSRRERGDQLAPTTTLRLSRRARGVIFFIYSLVCILQGCGHTLHAQSINLRPSDSTCVTCVTHTAFFHFLNSNHDVAFPLHSSATTFSLFLPLWLYQGPLPKSIFLLSSFSFLLTFFYHRSHSHLMGVILSSTMMILESLVCPIQLSVL